ncbi:NAD(P)-dependent oxidoreductase [Xanthobacter sp. VNH20]|uniref:NAD(P)-dependent oxidoreductase n=1 Tax=Xanthobacter sp. VNH20 TaxID=3156616 RepID=UPI0032B4D9EB
MIRVGFVGLGAMGLPMASNLLKAGFPVRAYDRRPEPVETLVAAGGTAAHSAAEAARDADVLVLMVINASQAEDVLFVGGALDALPPDATVVLMATCPPQAVARIAERVEATGRAFLDAPVSGGVVGAAAGTLSIMAAAPQATFERLRPLLEAMGGKLIHVGETAGQGAMAKTINQLLCGVHLAAAAEAISLAEKAGVAPAVALDIVSASAASSWMLRDRGPRMLEQDPIVTSAVDIFVKDLGIVLAAGSDARAALPLAAAAHQMFLAVSGQGKGAQDDSQVIEAYRRLRGA